MADLDVESHQNIRKTKTTYELVVLDILLSIFEKLPMWFLLTYPDFVHFLGSAGFTPMRLFLSVIVGYLDEDLTSAVSIYIYTQGHTY